LSTLRLRGTDLPVASSPLSKNFPLFEAVETAIERDHPVPKRGAFRDRHERWYGCGGRQQRARRARGWRTAKSCGPDASTLASSRRMIRWRRRQESPISGESTKETVKTTAQGEPEW